MSYNNPGQQRYGAPSPQMSQPSGQGPPIRSQSQRSGQQQQQQQQQRAMPQPQRSYTQNTVGSDYSASSYGSSVPPPPSSNGYFPQQQRGAGGYSPVTRAPTREDLRYMPPSPGHPLTPPPQAVIDMPIPGAPGGFLAQNGFAPAAQRKRTVRKIPLTPQGNLVIDIPVPDRVLQSGKYRDSEEFTHMRYTAVTCGADDFPSKGYSLRQQEYKRQTEIFVVVTMYNEDDFLFCKSMSAIMKNVAHLCSRNRSKIWGNEGWKKVVVCIVSDGRTKVNPRVLDVLGVMGAYQEGIMKDHVNDKPVTAHLFEYTTQVCMDTKLDVKGPEKGFVPVQILFCLKEKNAKKINSHRWFFNAFGPLIRPNVCMLIDVGTKPAETSLYHLWKAFDRDPSVGGACGEIYAEVGTGCSNLLNPLVAAQNFEYKMSNILDKPLESVFGYISVLPGAFSAYRYVALLGKPLAQYFKGETMHGGSDIFAANMYLAEDRILCFELVTKRDQAWLLKYVKSAKAETDVPDNVPEFISQRRRWLNGSFFAGVHALTHWYFVWRSGHGFLRKFLLMIEFIYNMIMTAFNWFGLSFFYLTFYFLANADINAEGTNAKSDPFYPHGDNVFYFLRSFYLFALIVCFISSLGNRPQGSKWVYTLCMILFAGIMGIMLFYCGYNVFLTIPKTSEEWRNIGTILQQRPALRDIFVSLASTYGLYFIASFLYFEPWHMFTSFIQYLFLMPSFLNILMVYAFANLHDVSWGTKGDNSAATDLGQVTATKTKDGKQIVAVEVPTDRNDINANYSTFVSRLQQPRPKDKSSRDAKTKTEDKFRQYRTNLLLSWMFSNALVVIVLTSEVMSTYLFTKLGVDENDGQFNPFLKFTFYSVLGISCVRFIGCVVYLIQRMICG
ncbi:chitin synthase-domain-containing protein [Gaertneriomyces semiglobifer]|nr:chitin synthase-domain-containing protein [Gaertneriomyces semiglobifer]